jgi:hypothetical protein
LSQASRYVLEVSMLAQRASRGKGAHVSAAQHGTGRDDSKGFAPGPIAPGSSPDRPAGRRFGPGRSPSPALAALRAALAAAGFAGALLLIVATFATIIEITVETTTRGIDFDAAQSGWDRHGPALIVLALLALWLLAAALRGTRVAMTGLALTGIVTLAIAVHWDRAHVHDTGSVGEVYEEATAEPGTGYYLETLGGVLLLVTGSALLVFGSAPVKTPAQNADGRPVGGRRTEAG